jgi:hypothetical protein
VLAHESQKMSSQISLSDNTVKRPIDELAGDTERQVLGKIKAFFLFSATIPLIKLNAACCSSVLDLWLMQL